MRLRPAISFLVISLLISLVPLAAVSAQEASQSFPPGEMEAVGDYNNGQPIPLETGSGRAAARTAAGRARVGQTKLWLALDDFKREAYTKEFELRGIGEHIEVWVAAGSDDVSTGVRFPAGDCRNARVRITDRQVRYLIGQFDNNIYPKESRTFSLPPRRNGSNAPLAQEIGRPNDYYRGRGDRIVTLIDNVRDSHFYDMDNSQSRTYIAGFYSSYFSNQVNRNVMTIDAFDWKHRTGPNPPHEPVPGDPCTSAPARPFAYEAIFAHEYQHLLESYEDPDEPNWVNEGLSDWAVDLTNYSDPRVPPSSIGFDGHVWAFLGYLGIQTPAIPNPRDMGPENSLTWWGDQPGDEILVDYGAAFTMMEFLHARFGRDFMTRLHREDANGFAGLAQATVGETAPAPPAQLVHQWLAAVVLDGVLDDGASLQGGDANTYKVGSLDASINWDMTHAYSTPGAPPNGGDFVRLRDADGYLTAGELGSIEFSGSLPESATSGGWTVQLVAYDDAHAQAWIHELTLDPNFYGTLSGAALTNALGSTANTVAAIVTFDDPTEQIREYARYTLSVNDVTQPGG